MTLFGGLLDATYAGQMLIVGLGVFYETVSWVNYSGGVDGFTLLGCLRAQLALALHGRGRAVMSEDGSLIAVVSDEPGDPLWVIAPFDAPDSLVLLGGCAVRLVLLASNPDDPTDLIDQVFGVLDGHLTEYLRLDERGAVSVGYAHHYSGGGSRWGVGDDEPGVVAVRYPPWRS